MAKKTQQAPKAKVNQKHAAKKSPAKVAARGRQPEPAAKDVKAPAGKRDPRIPAPGAVLKRECVFRRIVSTDSGDREQPFRAW